MGRQIAQLMKLKLCNIFQLNEFRYTKDKKKKMRFVGLAACWAIVLLMLFAYVAAMDYGYILLGMADIVPMMSVVILSIVILFFSIFKAGSIIFQMKDYEMLMALPVTKTAIIISRFSYMYVTNVLMSFFVMLPGIVLYGVFEKPRVSFYILSIVGTFLIPAIPMTIATALGGLVTGISARMKHKSMVSSLLTIAFVVVLLLISMCSSNMGTQMTEDTIRHLSELLTVQVKKMYLPAIWYNNGVTNNDFSAFLCFVAVSVFFFAAVVAVLNHFFVSICMALKSHEAGKSADISRLKTNSAFLALYKKEWKRYLSSSIYVINTVTGYVLMLVFSIAIFFVGVDKMEQMMGLPDIVKELLPFLLAAMPSIMTTTACAISLEGKQWELTKSLPVCAKDILGSKIMVNLTLAAPFYLLSEIFCCMAVRTTFLGYILLILIPLIYIVFVSVLGISVNLALPVFDWENETTVVKQSAATMVTMLLGMVSVIIPIGVVLGAAFMGISVNLIYLVTIVIIGLITIGLYHRNRKVDLKKL